MEELYNLLKECTVKVNITGEFITGFFVAHGQVITCIDQQDNINLRKVAVHWKGHEFEGSIEFPTDSLIALIKIDKAPHNHPCIHLSNSSEPFSKLYAYDFVDEDKENRLLFKLEGN